MSNSTAAPAPCRNCAQPLAPAMKYCPACGQSTALHPPSAREFVHEFIGHYIALEGKLWKTLAKLAVPGALTREYLAGRRQRYIHPLRLYLTFSVLLFLGLSLTGASIGVGAPGESGFVVSDEGVDLKVRGAAGAAQAQGVVKADADDPPWVKDWIAKVSRFQDPQWRQSFRRTTLAYMPYALMLLVPLLALMLKLAYLKRPVLYGEHLVSAMHLQTALFILLLLPLLLPFAAVSQIANGLFVIYMVIALRRVYGGRWWASLLRGAFVAMGYFITAGLALAAVIGGVLFFS
jgi:hypothetical protein